MVLAELFRAQCAALGFVAVLLREGEGVDKARAASDVGQLIEAFCREAVPDAVASLGLVEKPAHADHAVIDDRIKAFKDELVEKGDARLPPDRKSLLCLYERLLQRRLRRQERHFFAAGPDDLIANRILALIDEEIEADNSEQN